MKLARTLGSVAVVSSALFGVLLAHGKPAHGIAYQSTSTVTARPGAEISDVYLFPSPTNSTNVVAVMDVDPGIPAGGGSNPYFDNSVLYQMKFDRSYPANEAVGSGPTEDFVLQFSVSQPANGTQQILFYGAAAPNQTGTTNTLLNGGTAVASGAINTSFSGGAGSGITIFAGLRSDPYFFDQAQYFKIFPDRQRGSTAASCLPSGNDSCPNGFNDPGTDFFASTDVLSIVVEMPRTLLVPTATGSLGKIAYWATTSTVSGS